MELESRSEGPDLAVGADSCHGGGGQMTTTHPGRLLISLILKSYILLLILLDPAILHPTPDPLHPRILLFHPNLKARLTQNEFMTIMQAMTADAGSSSTDHREWILGSLDLLRGLHSQPVSLEPPPSNLGRGGSVGY